MRRSQEFFSQDPLDVARALLGDILVHDHPDRGRIAGRIVEVEAYRGAEDQACHARAGRTARTEVMYGPPGRAYVYLIYGMYHLLNCVAWPDGKPAAVLIRGIEPISGIDRTTDGPGKLTRAMEIDMRHNRLPLDGKVLWIEASDSVSDTAVERGPRVGVDYAGAWAAKPWRFWIKENRYVSRRR